MKIQRLRWIAVRKEDGAIFSGTTGYYDFRTMENLAMAPIKFYQSAAQAVARAKASTGLKPGEIVAVKVRETVETV